MNGLTSAKSNRGGSRGTRLTAQRYDFNVRDGKSEGVPINNIDLKLKMLPPSLEVPEGYFCPRINTLDNIICHPDAPFVTSD